MLGTWGTNGVGESVRPLTVVRSTDRTIHTYGFWLCRICRSALAIYPTERTWRWMIFGVQGAVTFRSPLACVQCRVMRFAEVRRLGREDHRRFWMAVIALWEGRDYPTMGRAMRIAFRLRRRLGRDA